MEGILLSILKAPYTHVLLCPTASQYRYLLCPQATSQPDVSRVILSYVDMAKYMML